MTSQQLGDLALEEHRAVMAALIRDNISRATLEQYEAKLREISEIMSCVSTSSPSCLSSSSAS
jgi:hypothetical protein